MATRIHRGAAAPYKYRLKLRSTTTDLSLATAARLEVDRTGSRFQAFEAWPAEIVAGSQGVRNLDIRHAFVEGDVPAFGKLRVRAVLTMPDGELMSHETDLLVG